MKKITYSSLLSIIIGFSILISYNSCKNPAKEVVSTAREVVGLAKDVKELIESFTNDNSVFADDVQKVTKTAENGLKDFKTEQVATFWEKYWTKIEEKQNELELKLKEIEIKSNLYFTELINNNSQIQDPKLKKQDKLKNDTLFNQWISEYKKAQEIVANSKKMVLKGSDYKHILRNDAARKVIINIVDKELPQIINQAESIKNEIKLFEANTKLIFNSNK